MFKLLYRIVENSVEDLRGVSSSVFEAELGDIDGQIQISFDEHKFGYVTEEVPFANERLLLWFGLLLDVLTTLNETKYALMRYLGSHDVCIEFVEKGERVEISELKITTVKGPTPYILKSRPLQIKQICWTGISVLKRDLVHEITSQSRNLINDLYRINPEICNTWKLRNLTKKLHDTK